MEKITERLLKKVEAGGLVIWVALRNDTMWVSWNYIDGKPYQQRSEWLSHVKDALYSTYTQWDELDFALDSLGVKKVGDKSHVEDWGNDDTDVFVNSLYDFSTIIN